MTISTMLSRRRALLGGTLAIGVGLLLNVAVFACSFFEGTLQVCGDQAATCVTSTGTGQFASTQTGSTSAGAPLGSVTVSAGTDPSSSTNHLTASHQYWIKVWDPAADAATETTLGVDYCPLLGRAVTSVTTDSSGDFGSVAVSLAPDTPSTALGTGWVCVTDKQVGAGATGNQASITIVPAA